MKVSAVLLAAGAAKLHEALDANGIANSFEIHPGTQEQVIPFFGKALVQ